MLNMDFILNYADDDQKIRKAGRRNAAVTLLKHVPFKHVPPGHAPLGYMHPSEKNDD